MKTGRSLLEIASELDRQQASKKDLVVPSERMQLRTREGGLPSVEVEEPAGRQAYGITELARRQLAEKLKIPYGYFERMRVEMPELLDRNVNAWLASEHGESRLLRTLDGQVRAVLSERYRRLDNDELAEHVIPILQRLPQARFESVELTQTKLYLKVVTPTVEQEIIPGDVVQAGVVISNSEVGQGSLTVQPLVYRLKCRNGLIASDRTLRKTHVGRVLGAESDSLIALKDDTLQAEDRAFFLKVRDVVEAAVTESTFHWVVEKLRRTVSVPLTGDPARTVQVLAIRHALNEEERAGVLRQLITEGELTGYGLINAVTGYSQQVPDYDRATEFEAIGGKLVDLTTEEWKEFVQA